jgi:HAD superfamily hydrolase (TIGR01509 family)
MKACLFDLDGTLVQSEGLKAQALAAACVGCGAPQADPRLYAEVMGQDWNAVTGHFFKTYRIEIGAAEFNDRFRAIYLSLMKEGVALTEGAMEFIKECRSAAMALGLVTSADSWMVAEILRLLDFEGLFDVIVTKNDVVRHKPDPEAYLLAMSRLNLVPESVIVFEDSEAGLKAAIDAGCRCIVVRHPFNGRHDLSTAFRQIVSFDEIRNVNEFIA